MGNREFGFNQFPAVYKFYNLMSLTTFEHAWKLCPNCLQTFSEIKPDIESPRFGLERCQIPNDQVHYFLCQGCQEST